MTRDQKDSLLRLLPRRIEKAKESASKKNNERDSEISDVLTASGFDKPEAAKNTERMIGEVSLGSKDKKLAAQSGVKNDFSQITDKCICSEDYGDCAATVFYL